MLLLKSNDNFLLQSISALLHQKNITHTTDKDKKYFFSIEITHNLKVIEFKGLSQSAKLNTPLNVKDILQNILSMFSKYSIDINGAQFYPLKQSISFQNKETYLGNIHFIILSHLLLNIDDGSDKFDLYQSIWPSDKDIQLNKLDTHLTNLKNFLKEKINFNFFFSARSGLIHVRID